MGMEQPQPYAEEENESNVVRGPWPEATAPGPEMRAEKEPSNLVEGPWPRMVPEEVPDIGEPEEARQTAIEAKRQEIETLYAEQENAPAGAAGAEEQSSPEAESGEENRESKIYPGVETYTEYKPCPVCGGKGRRWLVFYCAACKGTGRVPASVSRKTVLYKSE